MAFSKKKQQSVLPDEVNQYYQSQRRERTGVAIMLGLVALVVTLLIGAGLFFGGRYVYRQLTKDDTPKTANTINDNNTDDSIPRLTIEGDGDVEDSTNGDEEVTPGDNTSPSTGDDEATETVPALGDEPAAEEQTLPATGDPGM